MMSSYWKKTNFLKNYKNNTKKEKYQIVLMKLFIYLFKKKLFNNLYTSENRCKQNQCH